VALGGSTLGRQKGFTLLELLVALVVLGLLVVGLNQGVRAGLTMWGAQTREWARPGSSTPALAFYACCSTGLRRHRRVWSVAVLPAR
jgi:prepilin-type N-terminal cleavage/methylation domain-containing protein